MGALRTGRLVCAALDPVLVPAGFQAGQHGEGARDGDRDTQIIFCAEHDEFRTRHPRLPQAEQQEPDGTCVDLVVEVWADGTLADLDLEGTSVATTLRQLGSVTDGEAVRRAEGRSIAESLPVVETALRHLFDVPDVQP